MPTITIPAGSTGEPIEVGPGTRVSTTGGYVQWTTGTLIDVRNGVATWQTWPAGAVAGTEDTLRRIVMRGVATGAMTLTWDESRRDEGADTAYWQDSVPAWSVDSAGNVAGLVGPDGGVLGVGAPRAVVLTGAGSAAATAARWNAAISAGGNFFISGARGDVIDISETIVVPSNTSIVIADGVTIRKVGTTTTQIFSNSDKVSGNVNISISGIATLDCNQANVTGVIANIRNWCGVNMVNVDGLYVGGRNGGLLTIRDAYKYLLFAANVRNFRFCDLNLLSSGPGAGTPGRDGIHLAGLSRKGVIERVYGSTNDDFIAVNPRAVPLAPNETYPTGMGPIREIAIRDIYGTAVDRAGNVVSLYGAVYDDAAQTVFDGNPDAASPTSTRPVITGIVQSGGIATATTDKAHRMSPGDPFRIASANPTGYNADLGYVLDAPTPTTFRYIVNDGTGAYVSGAALTIYWHLDNIIVENVRGNTFQSNILACQTFGEASQSLAVLRGIYARGITGDADIALTTSTNTAVLRWNSVCLIDSTFENISSAETIYHPLLSSQNVAGKDQCRTIGTVTVRNIFNQSPYSSNQSSGQGPIVLAAGRWDGLLIDGFTFLAGFITGGWRHGITSSFLPNSFATFRNCKVIGTRTDRCNLIAVSQLDATSVLRFEGCSAETAVEAIVDVKESANVTGGTIVIDGGEVPVGSLSTVTCYGSGVTFVLTNGHRSFATAAPPVRFLTNSANCVLAVDQSVSYGNNVVADMSGTGPFAIFGLGARIDVANAKVSRRDGVIVYNTNAAAGTLGSAGLVVGQGTAAGSWRLLANPAAASF